MQASVVPKWMDGSAVRVRGEECGQGILPVWHGGEIRQSKNAVIQARIGGSWGRARELFGRTGVNGACQSRLLKDFSRKAEPGRLSFTCEMHGAHEMRGHQSNEVIGHRESAGGIAALVVDNVQRVAGLSTEPEHRVDEARPPRTVEPRDPCDQMIGAMMADRSFSGQLASSVDGSRIRFVPLVVGAIGVAREDVVRRDGDQPRSDPVSCGGNVGGAESIDGEGSILVRLTGIDCGHGRTMKNGFGSSLFERAPGRRGIDQIEIFDVHECQIMGGEFLSQRTAEHSSSPGDDDTHRWGV